MPPEPFLGGSESADGTGILRYTEGSEEHS